MAYITSRQLAIICVMSPGDHERHTSISFGLFLQSPATIHFRQLAFKTTNPLGSIAGLGSGGEVKVPE